MDFKTAGILILLCIPFLLMTVWAVTNAAQKEFSSQKQKLLWFFIASIPFIGFIFYFLFGARKKKIETDI